jgi:hypothetical protein
LQHYYGPSAELTIRRTASGETAVDVRVPWTTSDMSIATHR